MLQYIYDSSCNPRFISLPLVNFGIKMHSNLMLEIKSFCTKHINMNDSKSIPLQTNCTQTKYQSQEYHPHPIQT